MKRRARRVTIAAAVLGAGVVAVLVITHWGAVRDHVLAWYFQLTRETETIEPGSVTARLEIEFHGSEAYSCEIGELLSILKLPVIAEPRYKPMRVWWPIDKPSLRDSNANAADLVRQILRANRIRVLEQRFSRHAYVVIREEQASEWPYYQVLGIDGGGSIMEDTAAPKEAPQEATPAE